MAQQRYEKQQKLGEGTYGTTFTALDTVTKDIVVLKYIRIDHEEHGLNSSSLREISTINGLNHPNIVLLKDTLFEKDKFCLVFENLQHCLTKILHPKYSAKNDLLFSLSYQLLCGVAYLHSNGIIHRDLRPENIFVDKGLLKICEFGSSIYCHSKLNEPVCFTKQLWYTAPELLISNSNYDFSVDLWSCGCIISQLILKNSLFKGDSPFDQLCKIIQSYNNFDSCSDWNEFNEFISNYPNIIKKSDINFRSLFSNDPELNLLIDLIEQLLQINPSKRINSFQAIKHPCFKDTIQKSLIEFCDIK